MWELDHKEGWAQKNWCFWTMMLEKSNYDVGLLTLKSPLDSKEIKPVNQKGNEPSIFIGRTDIEAEGPIPWPPDAKIWLTGKHPDVGKDWRQNEKGVAEDEMVGEHHWLNGHEFEQTPGDSGGQRSLVCHILGVTKSQTWLSNWMTTISLLNSISTTLSAKWISMPKCSIVSLH